MADKYLLSAVSTTNRKSEKKNDKTVVLLRYGESIIQDKHWKLVEKIRAVITSKKEVPK